MLTAKQTQALAKSFYEGAVVGRNVGVDACLLNTVGDAGFMDELFTIRGFRDLLAAALPPEQHKIGYLPK